MLEQAKPKRDWLERIVGNNPLLVQAVGLTVAIIGATSLQAALWTSAVVAVHLVLCELIAAAMLKQAPEWLRVAIYFALGIAIAAPATYWLDHAGSAALATLRIITPLFAANTITVARCERFAVRKTVPKALRDAIANALGFAAVAVTAGALREILGAGTIWRRPVSAVHIRGFLMPYGGFLVLGVMAAGLKLLLPRLGRQGMEEAMELAPEDRLRRLEKKQRLLEPPPPEPPVLAEPFAPDPGPEEERPPGPLPEELPPEQKIKSAGAYIPPKRIPVQHILGDLDDIELERIYAKEEKNRTAAEMKLLMEELETLLDELNPHE